MPDTLDTVAAEAARDPSAPVIAPTLYGRQWRFGMLDVRPSKLKRYAALAERLAARDKDAISDAEAIELSAVAEEMLRSALPAADQQAFDDAPFTGSDIGRLIVEYFQALGADPGESAASPGSSATTAKRSRPTSKRSTKSR